MRVTSVHLVLALLDKELQMKLWRKEARQHNEDAGRKHQGRVNKLNYNMNRTRGASGLIRLLFERAGIVM